MKRHSRSIFRLFACIVLLASLIGSALQITPVHAAGIVVNSPSDAVASDGLCTLREAIVAANADDAYSGCPAGAGADTITFAGNYTITLSGSQLPIVTSEINITGTGTDHTILQASATSNTADDRILEVSSTGNLSLVQLTIRNGYCYKACTHGFGDEGGAIYNAGNLTISNSTFSGNGAYSFGGAIYNDSGGTLTVTNSTFLGNSASWGGAIYDYGTLTVTNSNFSGNSGSFGGVIYAPNTVSVANLINSSFTGNTAAWGGAINSHAILTITNSTFSSNTATYGGVIDNAGTLTVINSTLADNQASQNAGGIYNEGGTATLKNSLLAGNVGGNCSGPIANGGNNLDSGSTCGLGTANSSLSGVDPKLGPLTNNGGPAQTFALLAGSPAIDKGKDSNCPEVDQRGVSRPRGPHCDIGAYEVAFPKTATFSDVPMDYIYWEDIELLYANGLTGGCKVSPLMFCPGDLMNRAQAAVFMVRGASGAGYVPNPATYLFKDDWSKALYARPWAEAMREANLTTGCKASPLLYCPLTRLNREQAVIFGLKMKYGNYYQPPPATGTVFVDMTDPSYYATPWAEQAYKDGLIRLCDLDPVTLKPYFCPRVLVTRGLAAYIIVRAKNLTMP